MSSTDSNVDTAVVKSFGQEWEHFDQSAMSEAERASLFDSYFAVFPWRALPANSVGFDLGCGTGRWALLAAPRTGHLHCVDPSTAIDVAARNLKHLPNVSFHRATVDGMPFADESMDFGYSLGVLHHIPDTAKGIEACVRKLRKGAPFLVYLYYAFDNQPAWFRVLWKVTDMGRLVVSRLPYPLKLVLTEIIAGLVYLPLATTARLLEKLGINVTSFPLSAYRNRCFYTMRTDAFDRFGTSIERRFTRREIACMMERAGLERIQFSAYVPFWCAVGYKK